MQMKKNISTMITQVDGFQGFCYVQCYVVYRVHVQNAKSLIVRCPVSLPCFPSLFHRCDLFWSGSIHESSQISLCKQKRGTLFTF